MYTKPRKCALKCHRCQRMDHWVKDCTIPKRKKERIGRARALGTSVPEPVAINVITSVWDEFPEIARPDRPQHVTSVWDEVEKEGELLPQQGFPIPRRNKAMSESSMSGSMPKKTSGKTPRTNHSRTISPKQQRNFQNQMSKRNRY